MNIYDGFLRDRKILIEKYPSWNKISHNDGIINIPTPQLLLGFAGYVKYNLKESTDVFFRGEKKYYPKLIPALFRAQENEVINSERLNLRFAAYMDLIERVPDLYKAKRFRNENINSILQHYGIKTACIDLVDNLFVAIWFSNNNTNNDYTYIKFICTNLNNSNLIITDLRKALSSLSLRPHCQHGLTAHKKNSKWTTINVDYSTNVAATVRIPNDECFKLNSSIFSNGFMFPSIELDNTYKYLKTKKFQKLLDKITCDYGLNANELGEID